MLRARYRRNRQTDRQRERERERERERGRERGWGEKGSLVFTTTCTICVLSVLSPVFSDSKSNDS